SHALYRLEIVFVFREILAHGDQLSADVVPLLQHDLRCARLRLSRIAFLASGLCTRNLRRKPQQQNESQHRTIFLISLSLDFSPTLHEPLTADSPCQPETPTYSDVPVHPTAFCKRRVSSGRCVGTFYSSGVNTPRNRLRMIKLGFR